MEHNIDLIKQIREAYAKEEGYSSFANMALNVNIVPRDLTEIAKRYAEGMIAALQSRCDRYEKALSTIKDAPVPVTRNDLDFWISAARATANEALNGEGEKEVRAPENKPLPCGNCGGPGDNYIGNQYYLCDKCMESPENI